MSRSTHDFECKNGHVGKVVDDAIFCPKCGVSIEGQPLSKEYIETLIKRWKKDPEVEVLSFLKEVK